MAEVSCSLSCIGKCMHDKGIYIICIYLFKAICFIYEIDIAHKLLYQIS